MPRLAIPALVLGLLVAPALPARAADAGKFYMLASARYAEFAEDVRVSSEGVRSREFEVNSKLPTAKIGFGYQPHPKFALEATLSYVTGGEVEPPNSIGSRPGRMSQEGVWAPPTGTPPDDTPGIGGSLSALAAELFDGVIFEDGDLDGKDIATILGDATDLPFGDPLVNQGLCNPPAPFHVTQIETVETPTGIAEERIANCAAGLDVFDFESVDLAINALWFPFSDSNSRLKPFLGFGVLHRWSTLTARYSISSTAVTRTYTQDFTVTEADPDTDPPTEAMIGQTMGALIIDTNEDDPFSQPMSRVLERKFRESSFYGIATLGFEYRASRSLSWVPSLNYGFALDRDDANFWDAELAVKYAF